MSAFLETFHFLRPAWLAMMPVMIAIWFVVRRMGRDKSPWTELIAPHLLAALLIDRESAARIRAVDLTAMACLLMALAAAGPAWKPQPSPFVAETAPLVVALDLSPTMAAKDIAPSRLERAKHKIRDLIGARTGARTGLVAFSGSAHMVMPLTEDPTVLQPFLEGLVPDIMPVAGKRPSLVVPIARDLLAANDTPGSLLFVTDGIEAAEVTALAEIKDAPPTLALIVAADGGGTEVERWASETGTAVVNVTLDDGDISRLQRQVQSNLARAGDAGGRFQDEGFLLAFPAALLLLVWFGRGWTMRWAVLLLGAGVASGLFIQPARAGPIEDLFWTTDQQAAELYAQGKFVSAANRFTDPEWRATALYRVGKYEEAASLWEGLPGAEAAYNRGNALIKARKYREAAAAYQAALEIDPDNEDAKANYALTLEIIDYVERVREQSDTGEQQELGADEVTFDLQAGKGKKAIVDSSTPLSADAAQQWMRQVETRPQDFLKSRFAIEENLRGRQ